MVMKIALLGAYPIFPYAKELEVKNPPKNTTSWNVNLARGLAAIPGNNVHFITVTPSVKKDQTLSCDGVHIHFLSSPPKLRYLTLFQYNKSKVNNELRKINPDIVHGQGTEHEYPYIAVTSGLPCVVTIHCILSDIMKVSGLGLFNKMRLFFFLEKYVLSRARYIIGTTEYMKSRVKCRKTNFFIIENSVDPLFYSVDKIQKVEKSFLFAGRISAEKGIETLLDAMDRLKAKGVKLSINILGVSSNKKYLRLINRKIRSAGLDNNIFFKGLVSQQEVAKYMAGSVAVILPSRYDAFGMVLSEAMATGTPVIASEVGGIPYVVDDGQTGFLVKSGDAATLAEKMLLLMENESLRRQLGRRGKEVALRRFHPNIVARKTMEVYETALVDW